MDAILYEAIQINAMRARHKKNVEEKLYKRQREYDKSGTCEGTIEDLRELEREEEYISRIEEDFENRISGLDCFPEYISVNRYSEIAGISIWKVYREIKKGNILAEKIGGRWRIYTTVESIAMVA